MFPCGFVATLFGSTAVIGAPIGPLIAQGVVLVGQGEGAVSAVGTIGMIGGVVAAIGGVLLQAYDRANARRRAELEHQYRLEVARRRCHDLNEYSQRAYEYIVKVGEVCECHSVDLPPAPGPPPDSTPCSPGGCDGQQPGQPESDATA